MKSCLYEMNIMHERRMPFLRRFEHKAFMFYLDLDEIPMLSKQLWLFGHNQKRIYNYCEKDHIGDVRAYLKTKNVDDAVAHIRLLANVRTFGYVFNPVSFYFCSDAQEKPVCVVVEIGNTFKEQKYFYIGAQGLKEEKFKDQQTKYYYISPFTDLEDVMDFDIQIPEEHLKIGIDVLKQGERYFFSSMMGKRKPLTNQQLVLSTLKFPLITLKVIFLIHWHALVLAYFRRLPYHNKEDNAHLQKGFKNLKEVGNP